jgi:mycofactocin biosynthesis protein MftB
MPFDAGRGWRLSDTVAVRPEPFGALLYDFTTRRLSFLKSRALVDLVRSLADAPTADDALASLPEADRPLYRRSLAALAGTGTIVEKA